MILCPIDFSATTPELVSYAASLAASQQTELRLLHVREPRLDLPAHSTDWVAAQFAQCLALVRQVAAAVSVSTDLRSGAPAATILAEAHCLAARLLMLGSHGHTRLHRFLMGSTAEEVLRKAPCPTLLVMSHAGSPA